MNKILLALSAILLMISCQTTEVKKVSERPDWLNSAAKYCEPKGFLCASSEARTMTQADMKAKAELASIFETKIESETTSSKSLSAQSNFLSDFDLKEQITKSVRQKTSQVLSGVKIIERAQTAESHFALAGIDILMSSKFFRDEIEKHDERLEYLYSQNRKTNYRKMLEHYYKREAYNKKLAVLSVGKKSPISLSQIDEIKNSKLGSGGRILMDLSSLDSRIADNIRGYLAGLGYQLVLDSSKYDYKIVGEMKKQREFFKVKGFTKIGYTINLRNYNPKGIEIGGVSVQRTGIGRTEEDSFKRVEPELSKYLENHLDELRIGK